MISLIDGAWGLLASCVVFLLGGFFAIRLFRYFGTPARRGIALYLWHSMFSIIYAVYVMRNGGDALTYFRWASEGDLAFSLGTSAIVVIAWPLVNLFGLPFLGVSFAFGFLGFIGLLGVDASLRVAVADRSRLARRLAVVAAFLPSISFWSSSIGKDSLAFMAAGLALWASLQLSKRVGLMVFACVTMLLIRPHVALLLVSSLCAAVIMHRSFALWKRLALSLCVGCAVLLLTPVVLEYVGLGSQIGVADISEYVDQRQEYNVTATAGLDLASMSLPAQLFSYMFRPLPYEVGNLPGLAASLDNLFLLAVFMTGLWGVVARRGKGGISNLAFICFYSATSWTLLAITTANLGIAVRQKWMFVPMLMCLLLFYTGRSRANAPYRIRKKGKDQLAFEDR